MYAPLPETVDAWRMVTARRTFHGSLPLAELERLAPSLASVEGSAAYDLEFGTDELGVPFLAVRVEAALPLTCQRTLETFEQPVRIDTRLGLLADERDEAALPPGYEPLLVGSEALSLAAVIEDELILALPLVPTKPGTEGPPEAWSTAPAAEQEPAREHPFAALRALKKT
ncbi:hypothetical protein MBSD_n0214 [Mizugakiibacter sediminis]|uniref:Large ribosomal RNA subunit accumulation protein YceD n=1 Tax=Mizugakiibacter sediminis TaxID=1475481 RepID=A0A0K8QJP8_9GAMM|nr:YceD family protein [Mizugakiibacter sediminis]GAP64931.1 hypothetical protein MBSD_n0214 [Mizugakiibacter sediminis]